jgi:hypothetical protein
MIICEPVEQWLWTRARLGGIGILSANQDRMGRPVVGIEGL